MKPLIPARVRAPGSTSNLGSGFDTIGLALKRWLDATFLPDERGGGVEIVRSGTLAWIDSEVEPDLVAEAFLTRVRAAGLEPNGTLLLDSDIPVARGMGASAAARVAGWELAGAALDEPPDREGAFASALADEGHADNAAPAAFGGLRAVVRGRDRRRVVPLELHEDVGFAYAAPAQGVSTTEARAMLPDQVPHATAADALGRVVALIRGLATADPNLIGIGMVDELHVPYRLPLIPQAEAAMAAGLEAGAWGVTVSGAGSGLIALCSPADAAEVGAAMHGAFDDGSDDSDCVGFAVRPSMVGVHRLDLD